MSFMTKAGYYDQAENLPTCLGKKESTLNRLERRKKQLEEELVSVNEVIKLFDAHPEIPDALDLLGMISL